MEQESSWFVPYTWNQQRDTKQVALLTKGSLAPKIRRAIEDYLVSIGFKEKDVNARMFNSWLIDFEHKTFQRMASVNGLPTTYPSHLKEHMAKHKHIHTGWRYGI